MITAALSGADRLAARFAAMPAVLQRRLAATVARLGDELQSRVRDDKLGGAVLHRRSGRLADSIQVTLAQDGTSVAATLGSAVRYAAIHEYGGTIPPHEIVPRGARVLAFPWHGRQRFFRRVAIPAVTLPERSFLRSALAEMTPEIRTALTEAAREGIRE